MKKRDFNIPILGLKEKVYHFEYELENSFFDTVEQPLFVNPAIKVDLKFDKRHEPYVLDFHVTGTYEDACDRCGTNITVPIDADFRLFVEIGHEDNLDETEVIYITRETAELKLYDHIHDYVYLSYPMVKRCESPADVKLCDQRVEEFMNKLNAEEEEKELDPRWEALKNLKK